MSHPLSGVHDLCGKVLCVLRLSLLLDQTQEEQHYPFPEPSLRSFPRANRLKSSFPQHKTLDPPAKASLHISLPWHRLHWRLLPQCKKKPCARSKDTGDRNTGNPCRGQQDGREETGLQGEAQERWAQGSGHEHRNHVGFLREDGSSRGTDVSEVKEGEAQPAEETCNRRLSKGGEARWEGAESVRQLWLDPVSKSGS